MTKGNLVIDVVNLQKKFNDLLAVRDISIQAKRGDMIGFLGPNGSGKTTTIRMLCGLLTPDAGTGNCLGYDILTESNQIKKHIGYVPQYFSLYKSLTVYENILLISELYGVINRKEKILNLMDKLGLSSRKNQLSGNLSGGWKQRLSLACALIHDPFLILLDEPTASVDPKSQRDFWEIIHGLSSEGVTVLLSSHNMNEVALCHRIIYVCNGRVLMHGSIQEIINQVDLTTWQVMGPKLTLLAKQLKSTPGIEQVITFFDTLHVSSHQHGLLEKAITPYRNMECYTWKRVDTTLDDVFIWLSMNEQDLKENMPINNL